MHDAPHALVEGARGGARGRVLGRAERDPRVDGAQERAVPQPHVEQELAERRQRDVASLARLRLAPAQRLDRRGVPVKDVVEDGNGGLCERGSGGARPGSSVAGRDVECSVGDIRQQSGPSPRRRCNKSGARHAQRSLLALLALVVEVLPQIT